MGLFRRFVSQTRKPEGFLGKMMLNSMNSGHAKQADWGLSFLPHLEPERIADLGCGGGAERGRAAQAVPGCPCHRRGLFRNVRCKGKGI